MPEPVSRFAAINQKPRSTDQERPVEQTTSQPIVRTTGRPQGKRSNPDFEKVGLYLHSSTRKRAERKWEDEGVGDFSDLVDRLLKNYLGDR